MVSSCQNVAEPEMKAFPLMSETVDMIRMGAEGDGVASNGAHIPFTLPGERVRIVEGGLEILEPSADRVMPPCPHFGSCGGCQVQHWAMEPYLDWKRQKVVEALARAGLEPVVHPCFVTGQGTRRRVALHARLKDDQVVLGFKGRKSWAVVDLAACVIADPALVAAFDGLRALARPLFVPKAAPCLHVTVTDTGLDVDLSGIPAGVLGGEARADLARQAAVMDLARLTLAGEVVYQARQPVVRFAGVPVALPAGGFLQAAADAEVEMVRLMRAAVGKAKSAADLFCGAGTFSLPLARQARVFAADSTKSAIAALQQAARQPGLKPIAAEARDLFRNPVLAKVLSGYDAIVFDPPRAGAEAQAVEIAKSRAPVVVGVSCNPQSFARDARILTDGGYRLVEVTPVDQFLWSAHVEVVGIFIYK